MESLIPLSLRPALLRVIVFTGAVAVLLGMAPAPAKASTSAVQPPCQSAQITDPSGDAPASSVDITAAYFGPPDGNGNLTATIRFANLASAPDTAAGTTTFYDLFWTYNGVNYDAQLASNPFLVSWGIRTTDGSFSDMNSQGIHQSPQWPTAVGHEVSWGPNGTVVVSFPRSDVGSPPDGAIFTNMWAETSVTSGGPTTVYDRAPDSGYGSSYAVQTTCLTTPVDLYTPIAPTRIYDTRDNSGYPGAGDHIGPTMSVGFAGPQPIQITGNAGIPASIDAAVLNLTVTNEPTDGYLSAAPAGVYSMEHRPATSVLNYAAGETVANLVTVPVGSNGKIEIQNWEIQPDVWGTERTDLVIDVEGYYSTAASNYYHPVGPSRVTDTRPSSGQANAGQTLEPEGVLTVQVAGTAGVPAAGGSAAVLNITVTNPTADSYLTAYPSGSTRPTASNLNFVAGQTLANRVVVPVGPDGRISIFNQSGSADVVVDLDGWYGSSQTSGFRFAPIPQQRLLDTRSGGGAVGPGGTLTVPISGANGVGTATGVVLNVTVTDTTSPGYLTAYPDGSARPLSSDLNWMPNETRPNLVQVPVGADGDVALYNAMGSANVVADLYGWFG